MSRFMISCGGTGGHLSPGIALAEGLASRGHTCVLLISQKKVDARLIEKYPHLRFERMPGSGFSWQPVKLFRFGLSQFAALRFCLRLAKSSRPDAIVGFGGFTSAPGALAGWILGVPVALHEANRVPGLAIRVLGRFARRVYLPPGIGISGLRPTAIRHSGLPVRKEIVRTASAGARKNLGFDAQQKLLVVLGGSQGATALNRWVREKLGALAQEKIQVYCVTGLGKGEPETVLLQAKGGEEVKSVFVPFSDRIAELLSAADLVLTRAGAGTLAELIRCETPAILIPYPHAASDHQRANAAFFERQGGGIVVEETAMGGLQAEVTELIFNDWLLRQFRGNLKRMDLSNSLDLLLDDVEAMGAVAPQLQSPRPAPSAS